MGVRRFLLLDARVVEAAEGVRLAVGRRVEEARNPLFGEDRPWELRFDNLYPNLLRDPAAQLYRCWYSPFLVDPAYALIPPAERLHRPYPAGRLGAREMGVCHAVSQDGIAWEKPLLGMYRWAGQPSNIVARGPHGAGVFRDEREVAPARRYKMIFRGREGMAVAFSADGLRWSEPLGLPELAAEGDTHNNAFWAPTLGRYVAITRTWEHRTEGEIRGIRLVARSESEDFVHWSRPEVVCRGLEDHLQLYSMPVFYYAGLYLGLPAIYDLRSDRVHTELAWSPDTVHWHRIDPGKPLLGGGDWGCAYGAASPVFLANEIRLYYGASDGPHSGWRRGFLALATLRPDGFAGYEPVRGRGSVVTRPFFWNGEAIQVTAEVERGGSVQVERIDGQGRVTARSLPLRCATVDGCLQWEAGSSTQPGWIHLRFSLENAKVYSFTTSQPPRGQCGGRR